MGCTMKKLLLISSPILILIIFTTLTAIPLSAIYAEEEPFHIEFSPTKVEVRQAEGFDLNVLIKVAPHHFLYKDKTRLESEPINGFVFGPVVLPEAEIKYDKFLDTKVAIFKERVAITSSVSVSNNVVPGSYDIKSIVYYQGCSEDTCFLPQKKEFTIHVSVLPQGSLISRGNEPGPDIIETAGAFAETIKKRGIFGALILSFLAGIGLSFTPCIYPMIPITVAIIGGQEARTPLKGFYLSLFYVLGIAIVYSGLGVAAASTGSLFGSAVNNPWVIGFVVAVFVTLALSMFGAYELRLPTTIAERFGGSKKSSGIPGVFLMGLVSGTIVSPCVGPVLVSLLVYISGTGNKVLGFWLLFTFAWGMGLLLIAIGTFSGILNALPRSGIWMVLIKKMFGILMLGAALYYIRQIIPEWVFVVILGIFLIIVGIFSGGLDRLVTESTVIARVKKSFGILCLMFGTYFLVGALISNGLILAPLTVTQITPAKDKVGKIAASESWEIEWILSEDEGLKLAGNSGKPIIIDFWADWCSVCKKMDKKTFSDAHVIEESKRFVNIKVDCTDVDDMKVKELWSKYGIVGLPTTIFIDQNGIILKEKTINGFIGPAEFLNIMKNI